MWCNLKSTSFCCNIYLYTMLLNQSWLPDTLSTQSNVSNCPVPPPPPPTCMHDSSMLRVITQSNTFLLEEKRLKGLKTLKTHLLGNVKYSKQIIHNMQKYSDKKGFKKLNKS